MKIESFLYTLPGGTLVWVTHLVCMAFMSNSGGWIVLNVPSGWSIYKSLELVETITTKPLRTLN